MACRAYLFVMASVTPTRKPDVGFSRPAGGNTTFLARCCSYLDACSQFWEVPVERDQPNLDARTSSQWGRRYTLHGVATPLSRLILQFWVCSRRVAATPPPPPRPLSHLSLPPRGGVAGAWALQNPVALQGVEQLHCSVSHYTSPLRTSSRWLWSSDKSARFPILALRPCPPARMGFSGLRSEIGKK